MAYSNVEERGGIDGLAIASGGNGEAIDVRGCTRGACQVIWSGTSTGDAVLKLQQSNNGTTWTDISGKSATMTSTGGNAFIELNDVNAAYVRGSVVTNTETQGTVTTYFMFKGR